jgi:hypothetical protein
MMATKAPQPAATLPPSARFFIAVNVADRWSLPPGSEERSRHPGWSTTFPPHYSQLVAIHAAPEWLWPALVAAMLPVVARY